MSNFAALWDVPAERIETDAEEVALIARAADGDEAAQLRLFVAYVPTLRTAVASVRSLDPDDARQAAYLGLLDAVRAFDPSRSTRLASILRTYVHVALTAAAADAREGFAVPDRTLKRWFGIVARCGGDVATAATVAPAYGMSREVFGAVAAAVTVSSLDTDDDTPPPYGVVVADREIADLDDRLMVARAFAAVDDLERDVCRLAYGFSDYDPVPDAEIGHRLGMGRVKTLRVRQGALRKMRSALGVGA